MINDADRRIRSIESRLDNMFRVGIVSSRDPASCTVRVAFSDRDNLVSGNLPVLTPQAHNNRSYHLPDIGEQVFCVFMPIGIESGFVVGSFFNEKDPAPFGDGDVTGTVFEDGTTISYDRARHRSVIDLGGSVIEQERDSIVWAVGGVRVTLDGSGLHVSGGSIDHDGKIIGKTHTHTGVRSGPDTSGVPS